MNKAEKKMATLALKEARYYFSQDGTGEFTKEDLGLSQKEWEDLYEKLSKVWNKRKVGKLDDIIEEHEGGIPFHVAFWYIMKQIEK